MRGRSIFRWSCVIFSLLMFLGCGGSLESKAPAPVPTPNISLSQSNLSFAGTVLDNSADRTLEIRNTGNANLRVGQISQPSLPFSIFSDNCSNATLAPSQTCSLGARFSPTSQAPFTSTLSIPSSDPDASTVSVGLSGEGYGLNVWINKIDSAACPSIIVDITVTNPRSNSLLNSLIDDDFALHQNGQRQNITATAIEYPSPVSMVLALDVSPSTANVLPDVRSAANTFINQMSDGDWAAICAFSQAIDFYPQSPPLLIAGDAAGKTSLNTYINTMVTGNGTSLYDAVYLSIDRAAQGITDKRAVIVLSDGVDEAPGSVRSLNQVISNATQKGIPVFTIFYIDPNYGGGNHGNTEIMLRLARETGGQYYNSDTADLSTIFRQITNVLSNKYTLNYTSTTCSGTLSVAVRVDWNSLYGQDSRTVSVP